MSKAIFKGTLDQIEARQILSLFKNVPLERVQELIRSGLLPDLRDANVAEIKRDEFRRFVGLKPLVRFDGDYTSDDLVVPAR